jgi:hypothetical protein
MALLSESLAHQPVHSPTSPVYTQSSVGQEVISNFLEIFWGGHDFTEGVVLLDWA